MGDGHMKIVSWEDIDDTDFGNFPKAGIPLAYFSKEQTKRINNYDKAVVLFEDEGKLFIGVSDGKKWERCNIPFNLLSILPKINQTGGKKNDKNEEI
jgi:hypothetical protein